MDVNGDQLSNNSQTVDTYFLYNLSSLYWFRCLEKRVMEHFNHCVTYNNRDVKMMNKSSATELTHTYLPPKSTHFFNSYIVANKSVVEWCSGYSKEVEHLILSIKLSHGKDMLSRVYDLSVSLI